jgi:hypothetical protein
MVMHKISPSAATINVDLKTNVCTSNSLTRSAVAQSLRSAFPRQEKGSQSGEVMVQFAGSARNQRHG